MSITPVLTLAAGIGVALVFEFIYACCHVERRALSEKEQWAAVYWFGVIILGAACKLIPYAPPGLFAWAPFFFVMVVHCIISIDSAAIPIDSLPPDNASDHDGSTNRSIEATVLRCPNDRGKEGVDGAMKSQAGHRAERCRLRAKRERKLLTTGEK